jgi:hypothetical protein
MTTDENDLMIKNIMLNNKSETGFETKTLKGLDKTYLSDDTDEEMEVLEEISSNPVITT